MGENMLANISLIILHLVSVGRLGQKMDFGSLLVQKKRKGLFWIKLKTIFFFYSFMKHCKSDATQNILCGFKPFKTVFLKKIERKFQNGMSFQMK